ncbi:AAA family ATPase [Saccharomonospora cyanea]|uniref:AAA family ATPase n=1 Tax=Saccharomonospora cyanea TaxID=40989 RepID=UPI0005BA97BC|nr:AAA family ATPase [Saccharomonospora cyanea]
MEIVTSDRLVLPLENRALLVVAGLPGAGKSTLLRDAAVDPEVTLLDTDHVRARLAAFFPAGTAYSYYRPLVHVLHILRLVSAAIRAPGPVVVHDPATGAIARAAFVVLGALTGRSRHLLWIDCTVNEALAGQHHRGRVLLGWSFARHARNAARLRRRLLAGAVLASWRNVTMTDRQGARRGMRIVRTEPHRRGRQ